jgi:hypothetical protein
LEGAGRVTVRRKDGAMSAQFACKDNPVFVADRVRMPLSSAASLARLTMLIELSSVLDVTSNAVPVRVTAASHRIHPQTRRRQR